MSLSEELIGRAREIAPLVAKEAYNTDKNGKPSDAVIDAMCDAQLMEIMVPKKWGGHELEYGTMARVVYEIAKECTSTAWVTSFYIGHNFIHSLFPLESQEEVFANGPYVLMAGTVAPQFTLTPVDGGYIINGKSQYNSGSSRAEWYLGSGLLMVDGKVQGALGFLTPASNVKVIENSWDVAGMAGTSSGDIELTDVFVPAYHTVAVQDLLNGNSPGGKVHANPIYSIPLLPFVMGETVPVTVGALRGAADGFKKLTEERYSAQIAQKVLDKQAQQIRVGEAQAAASAAELLMDDYIELLNSATHEKIGAVERRAAIRARVGLMTDFCHDHIQKLMLGAGGAAYRRDCPLQRFYRDISVLRVHGFLDLDTAMEAYGRVLLGMAPQCPV
ncbi:MAG: acyl-CoA dehydrogenase family protein [Novosphingobium sp.]